MARSYLLVISETDPVAPRVAQQWGSLPSTGEHVEGAAIRRLGPGVEVLHRPGPHVDDERLDERLPSRLRDSRATVVFPSVHRSRENVVCLTVHPLGNFGPTSEVGGRPRTVAPTDPRAMTATLRALSEQGAAQGLKATLEATHHGPELGLPTFFAEVGYGFAPDPPDTAIRILASVLREISRDPRDRIAMGVGGGHYVPHFTDLALRRRWAFGHLISRHALEVTDRATVRSAYERTEGAEGIVYSRVADAEHPALLGLANRLRDRDASARDRAGDEQEPSDAARPSGT